ncbi:hypothetical protein QIA36_05675 (plasmid) [Borreliella yangtzensis]
MKGVVYFKIDNVEKNLQKDICLRC